jgi:hypothetical protein
MERSAEYLEGLFPDEIPSVAESVYSHVVISFAVVFETASGKLSWLKACYREGGMLIIWIWRVLSMMSAGYFFTGSDG